jgi:hypothetical protein
MGWLFLLYRFGVFGRFGGLISLTQSSLSSLFLLFLAGYFLAPFFTFIDPGMLWQICPP